MYVVRISSRAFCYSFESFFFYNNKIEKPARISTTAPELQATYIYICQYQAQKGKLKQKRSWYHHKEEVKQETIIERFFEEFSKVGVKIASN